jgi:DNA-binding transcriptional LysR family regulator
MDVLDGITLDQLRTFIAAVDVGSFSAAARKLRRGRSVVSQTLGESGIAQLGVKLFDRSARGSRTKGEAFRGRPLSGGQHR